MDIHEEIHHFAGWEGGVKGHKNCEPKFCEQNGRFLFAQLRSIPRLTFGSLKVAPRMPEKSVSCS